MNEHERLVDAAARASLVLFVGGIDTGKSTLARAACAFALRLGRRVAYLDADVARTTVGPPATVGLKVIASPDDLTHDRMAQADAIGFVGSTSLEDHLLPLVGALRRLRDRARADGADLVVIDTGGEVGGIRAQLVVAAIVDLVAPDLVAGLQRGEELEPIMGIVERFFGVATAVAPVHPQVVASSVEQRMEQRRLAMARYFDRPLHRFRVRPTAFLPTLPPLFDLLALDRLLVGLSDGAGGTPGLGYLEHVPADGGLRLISPVAEPPKALRLGSVRLEDDFRIRRVDLRKLFGTE